LLPATEGGTGRASGSVQMLAKAIVVRGIGVMPTVGGRLATVVAGGWFSIASGSLL
jgi:hypothetical protein